MYPGMIAMKAMMKIANPPPTSAFKSSYQPRASQVENPAHIAAEQQQNTNLTRTGR